MITVQHSHEKWRTWLRKTLAEARGQINQVQGHYKRQYDGLLRRHRERIKKGDYFYLISKRLYETETGPKLASVAEGPLPVVNIRDNMVVVKRVDDYVERVSRDLVVLSPTRLTVV